VKTERLLLVDIETGERLRAVDPAKVSGLKASIAEIGLRTPITVSASRDGDEWNFRLVAGAHRLEALRLLGEEYADCFVMEGDADDAALWEIDENFARSELTDAQRADHHARRKAILERKGLVRPNGRPSKVSQNAKVSYADQAAETLGVHKSTVGRDLHRAKHIAPDVMAEVTGTPLDKGVVLDELARTPQADQHDKLAEIAARYKAKTPLAADPLNDLEATEKQLAALMSAWNRAGPEAREKFLETIDGPVFDRGQK
jgi:hypothetical protein